MFHVKQIAKLTLFHVKQGHWPTWNQLEANGLLCNLLADTELSEDDVKDVFDVHPAGQTP